MNAKKKKITKTEYKVNLSKVRKAIIERTERKDKIARVDISGAI